MLNEIGNGIYFGFAGVDIDAQGRRVAPPVIENVEASGEKKEEQACGRVWPMVMSIGLNPFYKNETRSVVRYIPSPLGPISLEVFGLWRLPYSKKKKQEIHLITPQPIENDFYGAKINCLVLGFIRPELDFESLEALVRDIMTDIEVAKISLERDMWREVGKKEESWLLGF